ncbi:hypothetical protein H0O03_04755 [Candidatus Micrarchaeota archaeon]|nr:hypothetical protein [Candidatus Micrarchaeota archaeon]
MVSKIELLIKEFVLGFGFLGGLFLKFNIDPEGAVIAAFTAVPGFSSLTQWSLLITIAGTGSSILGAWVLGGGLGLIAVGLAFVGGLLLPLPIGIFFLMGGVLLAPFAVRLNE